MTSAINCITAITFAYAFIGALLWAFFHSERIAAKVRVERMARGKEGDGFWAHGAAILFAVVFWPWVLR